MLLNDVSLVALSFSGTEIPDPGEFIRAGSGL